MSKERTKEKVIIIKSDSLAFVSDAKNIFKCYSSYSVLARGLRKICKKLGLRFLFPCFYDNWKVDLEETDLAILFDGGIDDVDLITRFIKKRNPTIRLVFWYWNPVKPTDVALANSQIDEIWTYNRFDAKEYGLKYNPQFYSKTKVPLGGVQSDLVFMGANKGRKQVLEELKSSAESCGLGCNFIIVEGKNDRIKYEEYLSMVLESRCIVDIVPVQSCGLTLRPLEALFYKKKLITNYSDIINYDFYNKENVFIIGHDDLSRLDKFVNCPYREVDETIINFYDYKSWLERVREDRSVKL